MENRQASPGVTGLQAFSPGAGTDGAVETALGSRNPGATIEQGLGVQIEHRPPETSWVSYIEII